MRMRIQTLLAALLFAPSGANAQVSADQIQELLGSHNRWRAEVGVPNLIYSSHWQRR